MRFIFLFLLLPTLLFAQEFQFQQEISTIPVTIGSQDLIAPWTGGSTGSDPEFCDIDADSDYDMFTAHAAGYIWFLENIGDLYETVDLF
jgi:hypothetical protein